LEASLEGPRLRPALAESTKKPRAPSSSVVPVSYANCGLPYFISRDIQKRSELILQTPEGFDARYGVRVLLEAEAIEIDRSSKKVLVRDKDGESWLAYDKLCSSQAVQLSSDLN
jgi:hypothetical protein